MIAPLTNPRFSPNFSFSGNAVSNNSATNVRRIVNSSGPESKSGGLGSGSGGSVSLAGGRGRGGGSGPPRNPAKTIGSLWLMLHH